MLRRDSAGKPVEVIGVVRDIARRRAAEESLREQSQLFEAAFAHSAIGKCIVSLDGELLRVNAAQCRLSGYSEAELFALGPLAFDNVENFDAMQQTHTPMLLAGETGSYAFTSRSRRADGTIHWVEFTVALVRESDGTPRYFVVEVQDLTEARAELRERGIVGPLRGAYESKPRRFWKCAFHGSLAWNVIKSARNTKTRWN